MARGQRPTQRLKLVVRRLPPTLPEETFWNVVQPYVEGKSAWKRYVAGRPGDAYGQHPIHSRAYVLMNDIDSLVAFHAGFDGHIFRSKSGAEFQAVVEYSPVEKTPHKVKAKKDAREGTIDNDPDYLSFLERRGVEVPKPALETTAPIAQPTSTPLLEALRASATKHKAKAAKKKEKEKAKKEEKARDEGAGAKAAALASISDAANKRAPKAAASGGAGAGAGPGVVMVAGKGREVYVAPVDEGSSKDSKADKDKKKKPKPPKKKKPLKEGAEGETADGAGAPAAGPSAPSDNGGGKPRNKPAKVPKAKAAAQPAQNEAKTAEHIGPPNLTPEQIAARRRGAEFMARMRAADEERYGTRPKPPPSEAAPSATPVETTSNPVPQGTTPKQQRHPGRGRGGGGGGRGRGRGGGAPTPSQARIDM